MKVTRYPENPIITPAMVNPSREDFEVVCVFNAGVAEYKGQTLLLLRVAERPICDDRVVRAPILNCDGARPAIEVREFRRNDPSMDFSDSRLIRGAGVFLLTSISHLRVARSTDGRHFTIDEAAAIVPDCAAENLGVEDPRVTEIDGTYYITYKSVGQNGIAVPLASTRDWRSYRKHGLAFCPENLDVAIFPRKVGGRYAALHRPVSKNIAAPNMWLAYSPDLLHWGDHHFVMGVREGMWDDGRIGAGAVPIRTDRGWLEIYHGATRKDVYCLGAVLLDLEEPHKVIARSREPLLTPEAPYEKTGFFGNVVFCCGAVVRGGVVSIYYGAADMVMAGADVELKELLDTLQ